MLFFFSSKGCAEPTYTYACWLKQLNSLHKYYAQCFTKFLNKAEEIPEWLTEGCTYLLPKSEETESPSKYRHIICLSIVFKLLTGITADTIYAHSSFQNQKKQNPLANIYQ